MRFLFLDIDGVVVTHRSQVATRRQSRAFTVPDKSSLGLIDLIVSEYDMRVVVSSTWRMSWTSDQLTCWFASHGAEFMVHDVTPHRPIGTRSRAAEIREWVIETEDAVDWEQCLVVDDSFLEEGFRHLDMDPKRCVKCDTYEGFGFREYAKCVRLMGGDDLKLGEHDGS